ncbi:putative ABC transport system ATP-binding protein [Clostridium acetobutylicum]|uniref:ABC-transporter, ATP-binding protein n=1 Tax=Clostridium acetobutylicum (strain ATCC 824 / DSM 792 / JCM 1419 / IAM 19013 / LMG 5710 / NBRC 13948 / NRRL B-527 / VKM B-1787 / 2291 / W) TaxID=272562 RepID=Q97LV1_CLOAB|nr:MULTISPECIES: ABC transporter ATP-binding protein [Clostridium]MCR6699531.1 ABC transporter ATP-binding protein [Escherichia coli]AAK78433.1 ABC-transporter, ATP-binding protein [Clostridium acetobutylicum ATCC 824]ADZ19503.1 ABC-transporter, ATP-binding protein [Clostridium acetobutylicum EA 2018]AEI34316.1 ABC-transporter, ATP-binding protein [Clostridium acetobutylicum DSM 1731]AWV80155.1 ABC transporter ATP-binding protein [Clostridium acetobutylicum]
MDIAVVEGLCKVYGKNAARVDALININLKIKKGQFTAVVGPSGSGKSTLLHMIGGLDKPTLGKVIVDGSDIYSLNEKKLSVFRRRKIGVVFQYYNLIPVLTVEENIKLPLLLDNVEPDQKYIDELIEILNLKDKRNHFPEELSGGQQQRTAIGRALSYKPSIILADEPTGNLDTKNSRAVAELLRFSVEKFNQTLIMVTHDMNIASSADRIIKMEDGKVASDEVIRG